MPLLDVSELLSDPDFADTITVTRRTETRGNDGLAVISNQTFQDIDAVVTPAKGTDLAQLPDLSRTEGVVLVYTTFRLTNGQASTKADIVTWNGATYIVLNVNDYSQFGDGYIKALCQLNSLYPGLSTS